MFKLRYLLFLFISITLYNNCCGQVIEQFDKFTFATNIKCIYQDSRGYLWVGTNNGLFRYDGDENNLHSYYQNSTDKHTLSNNSIWNIKEDKDGFLWISTDIGLNRYSYSSDNFTVFKNNPHEKHSLSDNETSDALGFDKKGFLWAGVTNKGLNKITINNKTNSISCKQFNHDSLNKKSYPYDKCWFLEFDENNFCWSSSSSMGLCVFNAEQNPEKCSYRLISSHSANPIESDNVQLIYYDKLLKGIWVLSPDGMLDLIKYDSNPVTDSIEVIHVGGQLKNKTGLREFHPFRLLIDSDKNYWLGLDGDGLIKFNFKLERNVPVFSNLQLFTEDKNKNEALSSSTIRCLYEDRSKNIWIGTENTISRYRNQRELFQKGVSHSYLKCISDNYVSRMATDFNGNIWASLFEKAALFTEINRKTYTINLNNIEGIRMINDILFATDGSLYIVANNGLYRVLKPELLNFIEGKINSPDIIEVSVHSNKKESAEADKSVYQCAVETSGKLIYVGRSNGIDLYNPETNRFIHLIENHKMRDAEKRIRTFCNLNDSMLIAGTDAGLTFINTKGQFYYLTENILKNDFASRVSSFDKINNENLLITTYNGLYLLDWNYKTVVQKALRDENLCKVLYDSKSKTTYVSSSSGIYQLNKNHRVLKFDKFDGLFTDKFMDGAGCKTTDGAFCFGSYSGINCFYPEQINDIGYKTDCINVTDFYISGTSILKNDSVYKSIRQSFLTNSIIYLTDKQSDIAIQVAAMNFMPYNKNTFEYNSGNGDSTFLNNKNENIIRLRLSPINNSWFFPGVYNFIIRSKTTDGNSVYLKKPFQISIKPAFIKSIEFFSISSIILISILIYIVRYYSQVKLKQRLAEQEKELAVERERNRISRDLHDDLGAGLSSVAMMTNQIKELVTDEQAKDSAWEISNEANDLVSRMREIIWSMSSKNDTLENLIVYINKYSKNYLEKNYLQYSFMGDDSFPETIIDGDARRNIFLVVKETLHNIIKHSGASEVVLQCKLEDAFVKLEICDNGKGFDLSNISRFGNGLANMKQRMENAGGLYEIKSQPGKGTTTILHINTK